MFELNYHRHSKPPYSVVVVHGGPGAPGEMAYVAKKLSGKFGVIEPFQTLRTVEGQIEELHSAIIETCELPAVVIGHSWGAWLSFMLAAEFPNDVGKLILVSAGPFEGNPDVTKTRLNRLTEAERNEALSIMGILNTSPNENVYADTFRRFGELMSKADTLNPIEIKEDSLDLQPEIYLSIWPQAGKLRRDGTLLKVGEKIRCPVVAIHGDYDPHPAEGVKNPLQRTLKDFKFVLLRDCGHYPWKERKAKEKFFEDLNRELD